MEKKQLKRTFPAGSIVLKQDEKAEDMYIIESGIAELSLKLKEGKTVSLATLGPGEFFGEMPIFDKKSRTATITAITELTAHVISKDAIPSALENTPEWFQEVFNQLIERIWHANLAIILQAETQSELSQKDRRQAAIEVAGAAAHEINQPLSVLIPACELMKRTDDPEKMKRYAEKIMSAGNRISQIVSNMRVVNKYITKPYVGNNNILDLRKSSEKKKE